MHPMLLLIIAIFTPFVLCLTLFAPLYSGMAGAAYLIYNTGATNPLAERITDVFYIVDVYTKLFSYWQAHSGSVDLVSYSLPLLALPLIGLVIALWLTRKIVRKLGDIFHLSVSI